MKCFCVVVIINKLELAHKMSHKSQIGKYNKQVNKWSHLSKTKILAVHIA